MSDEKGYVHILTNRSFKDDSEVEIYDEESMAEVDVLCNAENAKPASILPNQEA